MTSSHLSIGGGLAKGNVASPRITGGAVDSGSNDGGRDIRRATAEDVPAVTRTLGAAFSDYAWTRHVISADDHRRRVERTQELFLVDIGMRNGAVWVADAGAAVAVWTHPRTDFPAAYAAIAAEVDELAGDRQSYAASAQRAMAPHRPTEPGWFLATVGVDPSQQGKGLGTAVIRLGLTAADTEGVPAYLDTSDERNVGFYERLGFRVTATVPIPDGGPTTWTMRREPLR